MVGITFLAKSANIPMGFEIGSLIQTGVLLLLISIMSGASRSAPSRRASPRTC